MSLHLIQVELMDLLDLFSDSFYVRRNVAHYSLSYLDMMVSNQGLSPFFTATLRLLNKSELYSRFPPD